ncbi:MAG: FAD-dependent oxidoreductase [Anaerolineales bacterium]|nr:FAD-dependent oxidoreductase [Anaerolineales bacterium]MCX7609007.1 FAD-dependent oxidoreductase [Anaerolineales bacterium]MDW8227277.1 FAD-dependent oxidoreductase [Anaerolineales bacterium]
MNRYVIVGSGVAGISAAEAIRALDVSANITLISEDRYGFYSRPGLAYYLTGELPEEQLFPYTQADWRRLNLRFILGRAVRIRPQEHRLDLERGDSVPYDRLLLAVGGRAVRLNVPGADLEGIVYLDTLEDARRLVALARRARRAVVVGGGITALEMVEGLAAQKTEVHYLLRGERYWPAVLDESESRLVEHRLQEHGIHLHYRTELAEALGRRGRLAAIRTEKGEILPAEILAVAIGVRARLELAQTAGLETQRGILVDEFMQTSIPDIFAAGDCAQVFDPLSGQSVMETLWNPARAQGDIAGKNMAGQRTSYRHAPSLNVTRLAGLTVTIIGSLGTGREEDATIVRGESEAWRLPFDGITLHQSAEINRLRLALGKNTLLGALVMGDQTLSLPLQDLIFRQVDITPIRAQLLQPPTTLSETILHFWQALPTSSGHARETCTKTANSG